MSYRIFILLHLLTSKSIYSFAVYFGSSVYSPTSEGVMKDFGVGNVAASLGLALYVLACMSKDKFSFLLIYSQRLDGIGPMLFSPLSE
jgi:MFS transporter, DHA1 family, multidrug resistance protein